MAPDNALKMSKEEFINVQESSEPLSLDSSRQKKCDLKGFLKRNAYVLLTTAAIAIGISLGFGLQSCNMSPKDIKYFTFPGELLMRMLQLLVFPLIASSLITGMSSVEKKTYGKIWLRALGYYAVTLVSAVLTGIILVVLIKPGTSPRNITGTSAGERKSVHSVDAFLDLIRNMFPSNMVTTGFRQYKTVYPESKSLGVNNLTQADDQMPMAGSADGINIIGLLVICMAFGLTLGSMGHEGKPLRDFFDCLNKATMRLISIVIWYSPVGILFLVGGQILEMNNIGLAGRQLLLYSVTVITGLVIHSFITLPLIYFITTRKNPFKFMTGLLQAFTTAFGTSSSSVTLPVTLRCLENNLNMDKRVTRFMVPVGTTLTLDGTALYEAVAALFIAQIHHMDLNVAQIIIVSVTATFASVGATGIPQGGLVSMAIVLTSIGLPIESMTYIVTVDWMLDRLRTTANVLGDCIGVGVVNHLSRDELRSASPSEECSQEGNRDTVSH